MLNLVLDLSRCLPIPYLRILLTNATRSTIVSCWNELTMDVVECEPQYPFAHLYYQKQMVLKRYNESRYNREEGGFRLEFGRVIKLCEC